MRRARWFVHIMIRIRNQSCSFVRVLLAILVFSGGGCVTTVAISWLIGAVTEARVSTGAPSFVGYGRKTLTRDHAWAFTANRRIAALLIGSYVESSQSLDLFDEVGLRLADEGSQLVLPCWVLSHLPDYDPAVGFRQTQLVLATGWPWKSMFVAFYDPAPALLMTQPADLQVQGWSGIALGSSTGHTDPPPAIPLHPIWSGLAADSAVWGAFLAAAVLVPRRLRALWRSKRGRCTRCGYPIGAAERCSECGESGKS